MKIKVYCDSGANIHSRNEEIIDLLEDWGLTDNEWEEMSDEDKFECVNDWANNYLDIGWEEI